jgi:peptide/nickel transport system permease protein
VKRRIPLYRRKAGAKGSAARWPAKIWLGIALAGIVILIAAFGQFAAPHDPTQFIEKAYSSPSSSASLGTDYQGRDVLSRFLAGGRALLIVAFLATLAAVGIGLILGLSAGSSKTWRGGLIMRCLDVIMVFPPLVFALLLLTRLGTAWWLLIIIVDLIQIPGTARVMRAATTDIYQKDYIRAAESMGMKRFKILFSEVLPNVTGTFLVELPIRFTVSIAIVATLNFLGFGTQPPHPDWGLMIYENKGGLSIQPWGVVLPVIAIAALAVGTNLISDGLARVLSRADATVKG